jgi:hypothetical protein
MPGNDVSSAFQAIFSPLDHSGEQFNLPPFFLLEKWRRGFDARQRGRGNNVKTSWHRANYLARQECSGAKAIADHIDRHDRHGHRHFMGKADCRHGTTGSA